MLAISNEDPGKVEEFLDKNGYSVRTAASSSAGGKYGVRGIPASFLIDPEGKLVWNGHPSSLSDGKIEEALRGARKVSGGYLAFVPKTTGVEALEDAVEKAQEGELADALEEAREVAEDGSAAADAKTAAAALVEEIEGYVELLGEQAEAFIERRDVLKAVAIYEAIEDEFSRSELGAPAKKRLGEIEDDDDLQRELKAAEAFEKVKQRAARLSTSKKKKMFDEFAEDDKYAGTKAAERARAIAKG